MRIAIASDDSVHIAAHAGRCRSLLIFDVDGDAAHRIEVRPNTFTAHSRGQCDGTQDGGREGHHGHGTLTAALADCQVLISRGMGPRLVADLDACGIEAVVSTVEQADEAARLFARGMLPRSAGTGCGHHA
jgi:predicted Fe-Mo cluster-binding NifX family protein